jgi:hypothetical protein
MEASGGADVVVREGNYGISFPLEAYVRAHRMCWVRRYAMRSHFDYHHHTYLRAERITVLPSTCMHYTCSTFFTRNGQVGLLSPHRAITRKPLSSLRRRIARRASCIVEEIIPVYNHEVRK